MDKLKKYEYSMDSCNHCGQCKWILPPKMHGWDFAEICPIHRYHRFDAYSGQGLLNISKEVLNGKLKIGEGLEKVLWSCTMCGACDVNCKSVRDIEVLETIHTLRTVCAEEGTAPESLLRMAKKVEETHNIYGESHDKRFAWLPEGFEDDKDSDTVLFVGCSAYTHPEIALAAIKILKAGGVKFRLLGEEEFCCGASLWRGGLMADAEKLISRNMALFKEKGIKTVITACAECFGSFRGIYPRFGAMEAEVLHITQVAAKLLEEGKITLKTDGEMQKLTYHDPCMLGRLSEPWEAWEGEIKPYGLHVPEKKWRRGFDGIYAEPRAILDAIPGLETVEMPRNKEDALCCAYHSRETDGDMSACTAEERIREAKAMGAEKIVSACPFCLDALSDGMPMEDISVLLARYIEEGGAL